MENGWPDNIEPLRAGLSDEEFATLLRPAPRPTGSDPTGRPSPNP
jgi:hypothetical protein